MHSLQRAGYNIVPVAFLQRMLPGVPSQGKINKAKSREKLLTTRQLYSVVSVS